MPTTQPWSHAGGSAEHTQEGSWAMSTSDLTPEHRLLAQHALGLGDNDDVTELGAHNKEQQASVDFATLVAFALGEGDAEDKIHIGGTE